MFLDEFDHIIKISIHALREESDELSMRSSSGGSKFQSTPSARRATQGRCPDCQPLEFQSTPSARRATCNQSNNVLLFQHFNPRPPRGERRPDP